MPSRLDLAKCVSRPFSQEEGKDLYLELSISYIRLHTANGYGATNTKIRRFATEVDNIGRDITYRDSTSDGAEFIINAAGVYSVSYADNTTAGSTMGLSLNSTQLTTNVTSITTADILKLESLGGSDLISSLAWTGYLQKDDIVRAHTLGSATTGGEESKVSFNIVRVL